MKSMRKSKYDFLGDNSRLQPGPDLYGVIILHARLERSFSSVISVGSLLLKLQPLPKATGRHFTSALWSVVSVPTKKGRSLRLSEILGAVPRLIGTTDLIQLLFAD